MPLSDYTFPVVVINDAMHNNASEKSVYGRGHAECSPAEHERKSNASEKDEPVVEMDAIRSYIKNKGSDAALLAGLFSCDKVRNQIPQKHARPRLKRDMKGGKPEYDLRQCR